MNGYLFCVTRRGFRTIAMIVDAEYWAKYKDRPDFHLSDQVRDDLTEGFNEIECGVFHYAGLPLEASELLRHAGARNDPEIASAWGLDPNDLTIKRWNSRQHAHFQWH